MIAQIAAKRTGAAADEGAEPLKFISLGMRLWLTNMVMPSMTA